jgi:hypothetical protein
MFGKTVTYEGQYVWGKTGYYAWALRTTSDRHYAWGACAGTTLGTAVVLRIPRMLQQLHGTKSESILDATISYHDVAQEI